jgi:uncharacterized protein (DUF488 family)
MPASRTLTLATVGYEGTTVRAFLDTLREAGVELLVDVRAVASSRRPGFAKSALAANLASAGIEYLHLRPLGTPADGRAAARSGKAAEMHRIFARHLRTAEAQEALATLEEIVRSGKRACILCLEADPARCHRTLVADALGERMKLRVDHLRPEVEVD